MFFFLYGSICYAVFFVSFLYAIGFVTGLAVPKTIEDGPVASIEIAVLIDALLLGLFAIQHSIMARPGFKRWWTRFVLRPIERSTFVLIASLLLLLMYWQWRPISARLWHVDNPAWRHILTGMSLAGFGLVLYASSLIDHFDLFGLRQVWLHARGRPYHHPPFQKPLLYRLVRNSLMLGFLVAFWSTPDMSAGHLLFASLTTAYIFFGIWLEERDLLSLLGDDYRQYRARTPMVLPWPRPPGPRAS